MKDDSKLKPASALPLQPVAEELVFLREAFQKLIAAYSAEIEAEIAHLQMAIAAAAESKKKVAGSRVIDLRDMLMLLRNFDIKPAKGRRRDLKKVENVIEDLREIVERWE